MNMCVDDHVGRAPLATSSLIICSRNRPHLLLDTIESVLRGTEVPTELIVVDQSDIPHPVLATHTSSRACEIRYIPMQAVGLSKAKNAGVAAARYEVLAFADDDVLVATTWFEALLRALVDAGRQCAITGAVHPATAETVGGFAPSLTTDEEAATYEGRVGKDVLSSGNMAIYRRAIDQVGAFDELLGAGAQFPAAEDNDLGLRLLEAGYRIVYAPQAVVYHRAWRSQGDFLHLRWCYGRGQGAYYAKYLGLSDGYMVRRLFRDLGRSCRGALRFALWGHPQRACGYVVYSLGILSGLAEWSLMRKWAVLRAC